ncbi:hypothetical protein D3C71_2054420 [compost metagenome]
MSGPQAPLLVPLNSHWKAMPSGLTIGALVIFQVRSGTAVMNTLITLSRAAALPFCGVPTVASKYTASSARKVAACSASWAFQAAM